MMFESNRNLLWARIFVEELARAGIREAVVAPGSRSTPLALALAAEPRIRVLSFLDERGAAFFALGLARAANRPVVLLSSSGTATANFTPAIIEASETRVPLIVLTADRPHELRQSGANQTIDQVKLYGDHVRWFFDLPLPEANPPDHLLRALRHWAVRAVATANGVPPGPVHLNVPFRKPLEPTPVPDDLPHPRPTSLGYRGRADGAPFTEAIRGRMQPTEAEIRRLADLLATYPRGLILAGKTSLSPETREAIVTLARITGYPILADPLSGLRFGPQTSLPDVLICTMYETFLPHFAERLRPHLILHLGDMPVSATLERFLADHEVIRLMISPDGTWHDAVHTAALWLWADPTMTLDGLSRHLQKQGLPSSHQREAWRTKWRLAEHVAHQAVADVARQPDLAEAEPLIVAEIVRHLPEGTRLMVGNSLPVRHFDQFVPPLPQRLSIFANRGASGIDGVVSTAAGIAAAAPERPTVLFIGDVSFYHDMNGLLAIERAGLRQFHIVLLNNGGGAIFYRLPIARYDPPFRDLFYTAHTMRFEAVAQMFGLEYVHTAERHVASRMVHQAIEQAYPHLIEIESDPTSTERLRARLDEFLRARLREEPNIIV